MTAGVGKARPPRSFPTGLAKYLRPEAQTQTVAKPRTWEKAAFLSPFGRSQRSGKRCGIRLWGAEGKRRPRALPGEAQSAPQVRRREVSALWAVAAKGGKATRRREQIQGLRAVSAQNADICERANTRAARGQRAERRYLRTSKYKGCARPARRTPIFATVREARIMEQPMIPLRPAPCQPPAPARLCRAALFCALSIPRGT